MGRLEQNRQVERDRNVLERILALLLALAVLTHRAASLPIDRRLHLLAVLGYGEAMARDFILAMASDASLGAPVEATAAPQASDPYPCTPVHEADDAALLAARFRVLALALGVLLGQARATCGCGSLQSLPPTLLPGRKPRQASQFTPSPALRATSPPARGRGDAASMTTSFLRTGARAPVALGARAPVVIGVRFLQRRRLAFLSPGQRERWRAKRDGRGACTPRCDCPWPRMAHIGSPRRLDFSPPHP